MIYKHKLDSFTMTSEWKCSTREINGHWTWVIITGPSVSGQNLSFPVSLPVDAIISKAHIEVSINSPVGGAAYFRANEVQVPSSGIIAVDGITATTKNYDVRFSFKSNGVVYRDVNTHRSVLYVTDPTLVIEYASESQSAPEIDPNAPGSIVRSETAGRQLPRLLDSNLHEVERISAKVSLDLRLDPLSTATMDIPYGQPDVHVRDFVELFAPDGSAGIFRVSKTEQDVGMSTKAWLKHAFVTLEDDLTIGIPAIEGTFKTIVSTLLASQSVLRWTLGDVELPDEYTILYSVRQDSIKAAIMDIFDQLPAGYYFDLDTLHYPWLIHLRALPADDFCEGRIHRNLSGVTITRDDRDLCTRVYPYGAGEGEDRINLSTLTGALFMDADTREVWGTVTKSVTEDDVFDAITLQDVAQLYLDRNKNPLLSVRLDAINLKPITGETLDKFYPGRLCRLALPGYNIAMDERVIEINYPDVYGAPGKATVTLANKVRDSFDDIANLVREASASKLIGGTVSTEEDKSSGSDITISHAEVNYFEVKTYGNLLAAKARYSSVPSAKFTLTVDGKTISGSADMAQPIDILRYLDADENGIPLVGEHWVRFTPSATANDTFRVNTTVILKTIEKQ